MRRPQDAMKAAYTLQFTATSFYAIFGYEEWYPFVTEHMLTLSAVCLVSLL
jgi:hypothetical protein